MEELTSLYQKLEKVERLCASIDATLHPVEFSPAPVDLPKVRRRRSQDEMALALRRLLSPDPRPRDDDSQEVVQDCFAEVMALRQITQDLMQVLTGGYQQGLAAIREMTNR